MAPVIPGSTLKAAVVKLDRTTTETAWLDEVVADLCEEAGLDITDYDVADLADIPVIGYQRNAVMSPRQALEPLQTAYFFDMVETGGKLRFVLRGKDPVTTIPFDDLAAHERGQDVPDPVQVSRSDETGLPREVVVEFVSLARNYQQSAERATRQVTRSRNVETVNLPIVMTSDEAAQVAEKLLSASWTEQTTASFQVSSEYLALDPADVVLVADEAATHQVRIRKLTFGAPGLLQVEGVYDDAADYSSNRSGSGSTDPDPDGVDYPGPTVLAVLDVPLHADAGNQGTIYMAACGYFSTWRGAQVGQSADGLTYAPLVLHTARNVIGVASPFGSGPSTVWDMGTTIRVTLYDAAVTLLSKTEAEVLDGANELVVGAEVIRFRTATYVSGGTWGLSGLMRGVRGTEWAIGLHTGGDRAIFLTYGAAVTALSKDYADAGKRFFYRAVSVGDTTPGAAVRMDYTAANLKPYAVAQLQAARSGTDVALTWERRTRASGEWLDGTETVPLGEDSEAYDVAIYNGSTLLATKQTTSPAYTYTLATYRADSGLSGASSIPALKYIIYQRSARVGRGYPAEVTE